MGIQNLNRELELNDWEENSRFSILKYLFWILGVQSIIMERLTKLDDIPSFEKLKHCIIGCKNKEPKFFQDYNYGSLHELWIDPPIHDLSHGFLGDFASILNLLPQLVHGSWTAFHDSYRDSWFSRENFQLSILVPNIAVRLVILFHELKYASWDLGVEVNWKLVPRVGSQLMVWFHRSWTSSWFPRNLRKIPHKVSWVVFMVNTHEPLCDHREI